MIIEGIKTRRQMVSGLRLPGTCTIFGNGRVGHNQIETPPYTLLRHMRWAKVIVSSSVFFVISASLLVLWQHIHGDYAVKPLPPVGSEPSGPTPRETYIRLPEAGVRHLLSGNCTTISLPREVPNQVENAFATITRDQPFALADPGARFNSTDVIEQGLPRRRLVLAGNCEDRWFIEYEHGGIGLSVAIMVLRVNEDRSVTFIWGRHLKERAGNLDELRSALNNGAFWDEPYSW